MYLTIYTETPDRKRIGFFLHCKDEQQAEKNLNFWRKSQTYVGCCGHNTQKEAVMDALDWENMPISKGWTWRHQRIY